MDNEKDIEIENGLNVVEMRGFLDITKEMVKCITREECDEILTIYYKATERLLEEKKRKKIVKYINYTPCQTHTYFDKTCNLC